MEHGLPRRTAPLILALIVPLAACKASQPALSDAHGPLDGKCKGPYADTLVDYFPSTLASPMAALGAPDGAAVALTKDAVVTVAFVGLGGLTNAAAADLRIHATVAAGGSALVRFAGPDQMFKYGGTLDPTTTDFDLGVAMLESAIYVRVIDVSGAIQLDSFEAVHDVCR